MFLVGMQEKGFLQKIDLQLAMGNINPPIKFKANDKVASLIQKIVESKGSKDVKSTASSEGEASRVSD